MNLVTLTKDQLFFSTEPCEQIEDSECYPRPLNPNVWPCPSFICPSNYCPEPQDTVCCCPGYEYLTSVDSIYHRHNLVSKIFGSPSKSIHGYLWLLMAMKPDQVLYCMFLFTSLALTVHRTQYLLTSDCGTIQQKRFGYVIHAQ